MYEDMYMWRPHDIERRMSNHESRFAVKVCTCRIVRTLTPSVRRVELQRSLCMNIVRTRSVARIKH